MREAPAAVRVKSVPKHSCNAMMAPTKCTCMRDQHLALKPSVECDGMKAALEFAFEVGWEPYRRRNKHNEGSRRVGVDLRNAFMPSQPMEKYQGGCGR